MDNFDLVAEKKYESKARAQAEALGLKVLSPAKNELFIDIDSDADYTVFTEMIDIVRQVTPAEILRDTPSPSGEVGHRHVVVKLDRGLSMIERLALQAALGSDRKRETLAWKNYVTGNFGDVTLFFEREING